MLSITLGSGSSEIDWRGSCRRYPKKVLERFSLRSFLRSSLSEVRGAGFGVGGASVLWSNWLMRGRWVAGGMGSRAMPWASWTVARSGHPQPGTSTISGRA